MQRLVFHTIVHSHGNVSDVGLVALVTVDADGIDICGILHGRFHHRCTFGGEGSDARCAVALHIGEDNSHRCASSHLDRLTARDGTTCHGSLHSSNHGIGAKIRLPGDSDERRLIHQWRCQRGGAGGAGIVGWCHVVSDGIARHGDALAHSHLQRVAIVHGNTVNGTRCAFDGAVACTLVRGRLERHHTSLIIKVQRALTSHSTLECLRVAGKIVTRLTADGHHNLLQRTDATEQRLTCPSGIKDGLVVGLYLYTHTIQRCVTRLV